MIVQPAIFPLRGLRAQKDLPQNDLGALSEGTVPLRKTVVLISLPIVTSRSLPCRPNWLQSDWLIGALLSGRRSAVLGLLVLFELLFTN